MPPTEVAGLDSPAPLSERQRRIADELARYEPHWAGLFEAGLALVPVVSRPGNVYLLAHAGRELSRAVIHRLADTSSGRAVTRHATAATARPDREEPGSADDALNGGAEATGERREVFRNVIAAALELDPGHPAVDGWFRVHDRLVRRAHLSPIAGASADDANDVATAFLDLTDRVYARLAPYFDVQRELDGLLAIEHPTEADVTRVRGLVERPAQRTYFFHRLAHPAWFAKLRDAGLLGAPGVPYSEMADGRRLWRQWPEGDFIVRMAAELPEEVSAFARAVLPTATNPLLWRALLDAIGVLPAAHSRDLVPELRRALSAGRIPYLGDLLIRIAVKLARDGEPAQAIKLARDLLQVERDASASSYIRGRVRFARIGYHEAWLAQHDLFPALDSADRAALLRWATYALRDAVRLARTASAPVRTEHSGAVPSGGTSGGNHTAATADGSSGEHPAGGVDEPFDASYNLLYGRDLLETDEEEAEPIAILARLVARTATAQAGEGDDGVRSALAALGRHPEPVFRRIELLVLGRAGPPHAEQIGATLDRIREDLALRVSWRREVATFLRGAWGHAPADARARFASAVREPDRAVARENLRSFHGTEPSDADVDELVRGHQRSVLELFGGRVPAELSDVALAVSYDASAPDADRLPEDGGGIMVRDRTGPVAPKTDDEMDALAPEAVLQFLREWRPTNGGWDDPTIDGLAYAVARYIGRDPARAQPLAAAAPSLDEPSYARGILGGLGIVARERGPVPWPDALALARHVAAARDADLPAERPQRADRGWREAKGECLDLIDRAAASDDIPEPVLTEAWQVVDATLGNPDTTEPPRPYATVPAHGAYMVGEQLVVARGTLAFSAVVAAVKLAVSAARRTPLRRRCQRRPRTTSVPPRRHRSLSVSRGGWRLARRGCRRRKPPSAKRCPRSSGSTRGGWLAGAARCSTAGMRVQTRTRRGACSSPGGRCRRPRSRSCGRVTSGRRTRCPGCRPSPSGHGTRTRTLHSSRTW